MDNNSVTLTLPKASEENKKSGWKFSFKFIQKVEQEMSFRGYCIHMDDIEDVLISVESVLKKEILDE